MKIITWNCNMAFRKKAEFILKYKPDIAIIPECEHPDKLKFKPGAILPTDIFWQGTNLNKGLGVFSYSYYKFQLPDVYNSDFRTILPLLVTGGKVDLVLFAVWANNPEDPSYQYIGQVWKAINFYTQLLRRKKIIIAGDFNSNTIWDKPRREGNHSTVVEFLERKKIYSTYHKFFNQTQGKEEHNTLFMYRHKNKPYHVDYCFASADLISKLSNVEIGNHIDWCKHSDHTPLTITFND
ncbi:MAG TPA: endonuclease/exonuclease/phosphatase family protein [Chitinophagaceae bacterium]|nr:endonuclease/exonuclease/phosphatase family protein [Chitinophagaceae bacterium]